MKTLIPFFALIFAAFSLQAQFNLTPMKTTVSKDARQNIAVYQQLMSSLIEGKFDKAYEVLDEDFYILGADQDTLNRESFVGIWKRYYAGNESQTSEAWATSLNVSDNDLKGTWVLGWIHAQWTEKGADQAVHSWVQHTAQIENGKVKMIYQFQDNLAVLMQMGFQVVPPATENR